MSGSARKLVVVLTHGADGDRASIAFTAANAARSAGMQVAVFLTSDGVELCRDGAAAMCHLQPFLPLTELIEVFLAGGGTLLACGSCFRYRGMRLEDNLAGVQVAGITALTEWLVAGASTLSF